MSYSGSRDSRRRCPIRTAARCHRPSLAHRRPLALVQAGGSGRGRGQGLVAGPGARGFCRRPALAHRRLGPGAGAWGGGPGDTALSISVCRCLCHCLCLCLCLSHTLSLSPSLPPALPLLEGPRAIVRAEKRPCALWGGRGDWRVVRAGARVAASVTVTWPSWTAVAPGRCQPECHGRLTRLPQAQSHGQYHACCENLGENQGNLNTSSGTTGV